MKTNKKFLLSIASAIVLTLIIGGGWLSLQLQIQKLRHTISLFNDTVSSEVEEQQTILKKIGLNQNILFENLNENREALQLPSADSIPIQTISEKDSPNKNTGETDQLFFEGIRYFEEHYRVEQLQQNFSRFINNSLLKEEIDSFNLQLNEMNDRSYSLLKKGEPLFIIEALFTPNETQARISSVIQNEKTIDISEDTPETTSVQRALQFIKEELDTTEEHYEDFSLKVEKCGKFLQKQSDSEVFTEKKLKLVSPKNTSGIQMKTALWQIASSGASEKRGENFFNVGVRFQDAHYFVAQNTFKNYSDFQDEFRKRITEIDSRTPQQKSVAHALERIKTLSEDDAFQALLSKNNLTMASTPRKDGDYYYFDIYEADNNTQYGAFAVLKKHGKIYLTDHEDVVISALETINTKNLFSSSKIKNHFSENSDEIEILDSLPPPSSISKAGSSKDTVMLLCGTHENNADTMIIARLSEKSGIKLLSIPRDIYYKNRKISTYYRLYGIEKLRSVLEEITGIEFDGHVTIDMYAFIDVINILGGITVNLDTPLIDPTYKIRENGEWKTLYFEAGSHHLSGIEALRIARSRHTSDDFDRSYRQQLIIKALFNKLHTLHAGKLQEVYKLFKVLYKYVDTDFSAYESAQFYLKYHDSTLQPKKSLSTDNILYTTYSNYYLSGLTEEEVDEDFYKGAWILLPKQNNWDLIPSYVYQQLYTQ